MKIAHVVMGAAIGAVACGGGSSEPADPVDQSGGVAGAGTVGASGGTSAAGVASVAGAGDTTAGTAAGGSAGEGDAAPGSAGSAGDSDTSSVRFSYVPQWQGVTEVSVIGAFGRADDWTKPLLKLTADGKGGFVGSIPLPPGQYPYLFATVGDSVAKVPANQKRLAIDPTLPTFVACPAESPSFSSMAANPCSQLTVPQPTSAPLFHVKGKVQLDGAAAKSWLVLIEREEKTSHHFFANRQDSGADGSYDFAVAKGSYRLQLLPPDALTVNDAQRAPLTTPFVRRGLSSGFAVTADVTLDAAEMSFHDYAKLTPADDQGRPLPITLTYTLPSGATAVRASVYGSGASVGDPWWDTPYSSSTSSMFDGKFTTSHAGEPSMTAGKSYWWGTWAQGAAGAAGVAWTRQSMVLPIKAQ